MNVSGEFISQFELRLDDEAIIIFRDLMYRMRDKAHQVGLKRKEFNEDETELIDLLCGMFHPPEK